jgi:hypothetical protein
MVCPQTQANTKGPAGLSGKSANFVYIPLGIVLWQSTPTSGATVLHPSGLCVNLICREQTYRQVIFAAKQGRTLSLYGHGTESLRKIFQ